MSNNNTYEILIGTSIILGTVAIGLTAYVVTTVIIDWKRRRETR